MSLWYADQAEVVLRIQAPGRCVAQAAGSRIVENAIALDMSSGQATAGAGAGRQPLI
jgi:hypothetical protein